MCSSALFGNLRAPNAPERDNNKLARRSIREGAVRARCLRNEWQKETAETVSRKRIRQLPKVAEDRGLDWHRSSTTPAQPLVRNRNEDSSQIENEMPSMENITGTEARAKCAFHRETGTIFWQSSRTMLCCHFRRRLFACYTIGSFGLVTQFPPPSQRFG